MPAEIITSRGSTVRQYAVTGDTSNPGPEGVNLSAMAKRTCLFKEGHQVCGEPAIDDVGIAPPGGGQVREVPACERHLQAMVETYFSAAVTSGTQATFLRQRPDPRNSADKLIN
jgi:hypothetical protein